MLRRHFEVVKEELGDGDLGAQTAQAMRNVGLALDAAGASYADIVEIEAVAVVD